jgi:hypothetical protein
MKAGSLVATNFPTFGFLMDAMKGGYKFIPMPPSPSEIYTCKNLYPHPNNANLIVIEFEEFKAVPTNGMPEAWLFVGHYWYEVQPPMDLTELLEETKHSQLKMIK